ncbi:hypothetical protein GCM10010302_06170 [Streptomyces polychromogenes]|uniref:Uncharacterized protein n=1 Tax=Streptomyces polychromogenes TaxID=67342 RepID=A0ABN0V2C9_9ACTN
MRLIQAGESPSLIESPAQFGLRGTAVILLVVHVMAPGVVCAPVFIFVPVNHGAQFRELHPCQHPSSPGSPS